MPRPPWKRYDKSYTLQPGYVPPPAPPPDPGPEIVYGFLTIGVTAVIAPITTDVSFMPTFFTQNAPFTIL